MIQVLDQLSFSMNQLVKSHKMNMQKISVKRYNKEMKETSLVAGPYTLMEQQEKMALGLEFGLSVQQKKVSFYHINLTLIVPITWLSMSLWC